MIRVDHEWTQDNRTYGRFIRNFRREERYNFAGEMQGVEITRGATDRFNFNYAVGHTAVLSPSMVLDMKGSWLRFNDDLFPLYTIDPASLGFASSTSALFGDYQQMPSFALESGTPTTTGRVARLGAQQSGFNSGRTQPFYNVQIAPTVTKTQARIPSSSDTTGGSCARPKRISGGKAAPTRSTAPTRARPAPPRVSTARASRRSCSAFR